MELIHSKVIERALVKKIKRTIRDSMEFVQTKVVQRTLFREDSTRQYGICTQNILQGAFFPFLFLTRTIQNSVEYEQTVGYRERFLLIGQHETMN